MTTTAPSLLMVRALAQAKAAARRYLQTGEALAPADLDLLCAAIADPTISPPATMYAAARRGGDMGAEEGDPLDDCNFRVRVKGLGRIAEADIELRPLTLFVGENNSGKSYLATLIWALHQAPSHIFEQFKHEAWSKVEAAGDAVSREVLSSEKFADGSVQGPWAELAAELLPAALDTLLTGAFRSPGIRAECVFAARTTHPSWQNHGSVQIRYHRKANLNAPMEWHLPCLLAWYAGMPNIHFAPALEAGLTGSSDHAFYFPASRTGFMHMLPSLVDVLVGAGAANRPLLPNVTAPVVQFLRTMANPPHVASYQRDADLADLLETQAVAGQIFTQGVGTYIYRPKRGDVEVPMGRASAVVSELAPLITLLRRWRRPPGLLVYEEPEAHLHPALQRVVAQVLVRLARRGTKVLVTTHSDLFTQQISNFIKLSSLNDEQVESITATTRKAPYGPEDRLALDDVAAYEFRVGDDGLTRPVRLQTTGAGIVYPHFNDELTHLASEALALDDARADNEVD